MSETHLGTVDLDDDLFAEFLRIENISIATKEIHAQFEKLLNGGALEHMLVASTPSSVSEAADTIAEVIARATQQNEKSIRTIVDELIVNAAKHGHGWKKDRHIDVHHGPLDEKYLLSVRDGGNGFNPLEIPNPLALHNLEKGSGRGVLMSDHRLGQLGAKGTYLPMEENSMKSRHVIIEFPVQADKKAG